MEHHVSPLYGNRHANKLRRLRQRDPQGNLVERWRRLTDTRPDLAARWGFVPMVIQPPGWAVVAVPEDDVSYTVGLNYRFGQREILISAPHLELERQKRLLNQLGHRAASGERFCPGDTVTFADGKTQVTLAAYEDGTFSKYPCGYFARFEELFEDRHHTVGGTLPVLWGVISPRRSRRLRPREVRLGA